MNRRIITNGLGASAVAVVLALASSATGIAAERGPWGTAVPETAINSAQADGCPIETYDGLTLYFASTRPGAVGGAGDPNDIWKISRPSIGAPWGTAVHLPAPVNSAAADFCPTPLPANRLYYVSTRGGAGSCGAGDIYWTRKHPVKGWLAPMNLGCATTGSGPNFAGGEFSPSLYQVAGVTYLYFSSTGADGADQDIYVSRQRADGSFEAPSEVPGLSTGSNDQMPNVSRDGLEIVFASDRPGGAGAFDVYAARRATVNDPWSAPVSVGGGVNTAAAETRPSLSGDGKRLHFGRLGDIWVSTRDTACN